MRLQENAMNDWPLKNPSFHCACRFSRAEDFGLSELIEPCGFHSKMAKELAEAEAKVLGQGHIEAQRDQFARELDGARVERSPNRDDILRAVSSCKHEIDWEKVVLHYDDHQPGHNALNQLVRRICAAVGVSPEVTRNVVAHEVTPEGGRFPYERQLRAALTDLMSAYENRGETTSIAEWDSRMKAAAIHARIALGNEPPDDALNEHLPSSRLFHTEANAKRLMAMREAHSREQYDEVWHQLYWLVADNCADQFNPWAELETLAPWQEGDDDAGTTRALDVMARDGMVSDSAPKMRSRDDLAEVLRGLHTHLAHYRRRVSNGRGEDVEVCAVCGQAKGHRVLCTIGTALTGIDNALKPDSAPEGHRP